MKGQRVCRKCQLWDEMPNNLEHYLENHINSIQEDDRAEDEVVEKRLYVCNSCKMRTGGICRACGCYVYIRASVKVQSCPYKKWK